MLPGVFLHIIKPTPGELYRSTPMIIKAVVSLIPFIILSLHSGSTDPCRCRDSKALGRYRYHEKHSTDFLKHPEARDTITCRDIIAWQDRYATNMKRISRHSSRAARLKGTPEDSLYTLTGFMYYVRHESKKNGDCDLHIEIGTADQAAMRAIVEVTNDHCDLQKSILDHLASKGYRLEREFGAALPCVVRGLGFYDGHQKPFEHGRPGKTNVSSWELHPVMSIQFN